MHLLLNDKNRDAAPGPQTLCQAWAHPEKVAAPTRAEVRTMGHSVWHALRIRSAVRAGLLLCEQALKSPCRREHARSQWSARVPHPRKAPRPQSTTGYEDPAQEVSAGDVVGAEGNRITLKKWTVMS